MRVDFKCRCSCEFFITEENLMRKTSVECPNCGKPFPEDSLTHIKEGFKELDAAYTKFIGDTDSLKRLSWNFTFVDDFQWD